MRPGGRQKSLLRNSGVGGGGQNSILITVRTAKTTDRTFISGKEKAHKHKQISPVTARVGGGSPDRVARGQKFMCCVRNPRNINTFVRAPGREDSGTRPGGSVTGATEKLFMCQMFMCLFRPLCCASATAFCSYNRKDLLRPLQSTLGWAD